MCFFAVPAIKDTRRDRRSIHEVLRASAPASFGTESHQLARSRSNRGNKQQVTSDRSEFTFRRSLLFRKQNFLKEFGHAEQKFWLRKKSINTKVIAKELFDPR